MAKKILIVEDEKLLTKILEMKLGHEGYEIVNAKDGEEGLNLMRQTKPDLVLLDIILPKKNGLEVMQEMRKDSELKDMPVIVISNSGQPVELDKAKQLGALDWIIKTEFDPNEVVEKVKKFLGSP